MGDGQVQAPATDATSHGVSRLAYSVYGLRVRSEIPLPVASVLLDTPEPVDVVIRRSDSATPPVPAGPAATSIPCPVHGTDMVEHRDDAGTSIWLRSIGTFRVSLDASRVDVFPDDKVDDATIGIVLGGPILLFVKHQLGFPSLHASAIVLGGGAVGFLGAQGQGKSTLLSTFLRSGAVLLADDAISLLARPESIYGEPGPAFMKMWVETANHLMERPAELPNLMPGVEKKLLALEGRYAVAQIAAPIRALYILDRYDPVRAGGSAITVRAVGHREALFALLAHTSVRPYLLPSDDRCTLPLYARLVQQAPIQLLSYPDGFEYQDAVHAFILEDLTTL